MQQSDPVFNEFVLKFANVNGSGSASANLLCAKALFRMGLPVSPKNVFPSNIQGMPTWYEIRVSETGNLSRREGIDVVVAMNPQTYKVDRDSVISGGSTIPPGSGTLKGRISTLSAFPSPDWSRPNILTPGSASCSRTSFISAPFQS